MPTGWWRVNVIIAILALVLVGSLSALIMMYREAGDDFDELFSGAWICFVPISVAFTIVSLTALLSFLPYRGSGRRMFEVHLKDAVERVEGYLKDEGLKAEKSTQVDEVRRDKSYRVHFYLQLDGRDVSVLVRGRELERGSVVFVRPWRSEETFLAFVEGLERAVLA
jgi:hypothetical protein